MTSTPINVPQSASSPPVPSISQIFLSQIQANNPRNLYNLPLSHAKSIRVENFSTAPILVQLIPAGGLSPFVFTVQAGQVEHAEGDVQYDTCFLSNLTDTPVPFQGIAQSGGPIVTGYVQVSGLTERMTMNGGSSVPPSSANPTSVSIIGTPGVGVIGAVGVNNAPGTILGAHTPMSFLAVLTDTGPRATLTSIGFFVVDATMSAIYVSCDFALTRIVAIGGSSNLTLYDSAMSANVASAIPLQAGDDTSIFILVTTTRVGAYHIRATGVRNSVVTVPFNFGNAPLITQPASGSSQIAVPGTAASTVFQEVSANLGIPVTSTYGSIFNRPTSIYSAQMAMTCVYGSTLVPPSDLSVTAEIGVQGQQTSTFLPLGYLCGGGDLTLNGTIYTASVGEHNNIVFPFPLSGATLLPGDTTVKAYQKVWANGYPSANVFTALNLLAA